MSIERKLIGTTDAATSSAVYVEDVFNTWVYSGTNATQTITNGIDLATKGGLVWIKQRSGTQDHTLFDTARGVNNYLRTNSTGAQNPGGSYSDLLTAFSASGFSLGADASTVGFVNASGSTYASWTFRKQAKFFDVVTYTGTGSAQNIAHSLGAAPGMIITKRTDTTGGWFTWHRSLPSATNSLLQLNSTAANTNASGFWNTGATNTFFGVGTGTANNASGGTYVAYLFADSNSGGFGPAGTDSVVACGGLTGSGTVNLGWEPQFVLFKVFSVANDWKIYDNMRGFSPNSSSRILKPNLSDSETNDSDVQITSTGFTVSIGTASCIYLAIRRGPMRTPTDATKVFAPVAATSGTQTTGFPLDLMMAGRRSAGSGFMAVSDRLRGYPKDNSTLGTNIYTSSSAAEDNTGWYSPSNWTNTTFDMGGSFGGISSIFYTFRRAPGFFDVVCYTGTGSTRTVAHNLGVAPELMIVKSRSASSTQWAVYHSAIGATQAMYLNATGGPVFASSFFNDTAPTSTQFTVNFSSATNDTAATYVAYLFASCPGVSKVGLYFGNGSSQTIDCGFASGARFVLIKRVNGDGDWYVWDSSRGIVSGNDPRLSLNTTAAEVTTDDSIDPASSGFIVNQLTATNINISFQSYIYLAIA